MNWQSISFDWNQARAFLATAEEGSLSAAARALGQTQPTLGRQVAALEAALDVALFERVGRSLVLTKAGLELLEHVRAMGAAAAGVSLAASGRAQAVEGHVSITATDFMSTYHLPAVLRRLRDLAPGIAVEVIAVNELRNLQRREADIAIRHARPTQPDLIARRVGLTAAHFYAAADYLARRGRPQGTEDLADADFIGVEPLEPMAAYLRELGLPIERRNFKVTATSGTVLVELARHGLGITVLTREMAARAPELEQVLPEIAPIEVPIWLVTHRELNSSRRIRIVYDLLAESFAPS